MTLHYDATPADTAEVSVRLFVRGKAYAATRWRGALICAAMFAFFAFLGFHARENLSLPVVCAAAAAWGAGIFLLVYRGVIRRRVSAYVTGQLKGEWPRPTTFEIVDGRLLWTAAGSMIALELSDLSSVAEERGYLELSFGERLCLVPLRAFASEADKIVFLDSLGYSRNK